ncbi:Putative 3-hydroxyacyl-CoA dehydrogenase, 6-phosphogluconate dehydrogenase-like domain superfamily [Septoria linicola]|uniref:L-gulonate 3-dehydrogenase n=1 Tax=Septoria linicola TaxID=215465 RepID=A0A9Q9EN03_9PEZI|nr:putative 3-hydroxyacyl-CoA dehydrogenase, 6-phosphogluconate dehydrogenase-like domain superfamily [Septoria linicola]USW56580.1 Putative 3-hydroxyacyl-CoA dehydrogenase, 6-phosphogluconate dehydrogenase-like domain superfamily [Septoria linicola]
MSTKPTKIAIIGSGTIGLSFAALHLTKNPSCKVMILDSRPDLQEYVSQNLPGYLIDTDQISCIERLSFARDVEEAVREADIVQEQGPEDVNFKTGIWPEIEKHAPADALFWSSTSGIPASEQSQNMVDRSRLVVCHPYNPPLVMPLLEIVRSPETSDEIVERTLKYWRALGRTPVVVKKECVGFVANRLAFALLREASSLVSQGIVDVHDLDDIVCSSMGPRWAVAGPFKAYHAGGGEGGLKSFMDKIGGTVQKCWDASDEDVRRGNINVGEAWQEDICKQASEAYGVADTAERDRKTRKVLEAVQS